MQAENTPYGQEYCAVISSDGFTVMKFSQQLQAYRLRMDGIYHTGCKKT